MQEESWDGYTATSIAQTAREETAHMILCRVFQVEACVEASLQQRYHLHCRTSLGVHSVPDYIEFQQRSAR